MKWSTIWAVLKGADNFGQKDTLNDIINQINKCYFLDTKYIEQNKMTQTLEKEERVIVKKKKEDEERSKEEQT